MNFTSTFLKNISSFIGDFSGFTQETDEDFLKSCELYNIDDCTDRTLSYVINFKNHQIYDIFERILFSNFDKSLFDNRNSNGHV